MRVRHPERGSILPLVALVIVAGGGLMLGVGRLGAAAVQRSRAVVAADAAALAGAAEGEEAARQIALENGGELVSYVEDGPEVEVVVRVRDAAANARARRAGGPRPASDHVGLSPAMLAAITRAEELLGGRIPIVEGYHRPGTQPPPDTSAHERGMAIDVPAWFVARLLEVSPSAGLCRPFPDSLPVHFEPCRWSRAAK